MAAGKKNPQEDIRTLTNIISSGSFANVHLLYGEEDYLRHQFRDRLVDALTGGERSINFDRISGKDAVPERVIDLAETMPFFSDKRVILVEDTGWLKSSCEALAEYVKQGVCESTYIVLCEKEIDKRGKLYKAIDGAGIISEFPAQDEGTLAVWASRLIKDAGLNIGQGDVRYLIGMTGGDMNNLSNEIDKLTAYCMNKAKVTKEDIDAVCSRRLEDRIFDMCESIALRRQKAAMGMYYDLIALRESPIRILSMITRQYNTLLQIKDLEIGRKDDGTIGAAIGRPPWTIRGYRAQTSHYTLGELKKILDRCAQTDMNIKSGAINENIGVEMLLVELSSPEIVIS